MRGLSLRSLEGQETFSSATQDQGYPLVWEDDKAPSQSMSRMRLRWPVTNQLVASYRLTAGGEAKGREEVWGRSADSFVVAFS